MTGIRARGTRDDEELSDDEGAPASKGPKGDTVENSEDTVMRGETCPPPLEREQSVWSVLGKWPQGSSNLGPKRPMECPYDSSDNSVDCALLDATLPPEHGKAVHRRGEVLGPPIKDE